MSRARTVLRAHPPPLRRPRNLRPFFRTPPHEPLQSRIRWSYFWYASILALGITTGLGARHFAAPLGLPAPGSREDEIILESLGQDIDALDIVKTLRSQSYNLHGDTALRSGPGLRGESGSSGGGGGGGRKISAYKGWVEVSLDWGKVDDEHAEKSGILGVVRGTRGLGVQRAFWNAETKEMVAVVWMGGGLSGWPGVVHGGLIATVFEEVMARMVSGPEGRVGMCYDIPLLPHHRHHHHIASPFLSSSQTPTYEMKRTHELTLPSTRHHPPPKHPLPNLRQAHILPRLLHPARLLLQTRSTTDTTTTSSFSSFR